jgi:ABC-type lipoprotein release transport system permease subunit
MQFHKLAWRNIWRNKRRTLLTSASVVIAVFFSVLLESLNEGMWDYLIDNDIRMYSGHIEIHNKDYWQNKSIENAMVEPEEIYTTLDSMPKVVSYTSRLDIFVMASQGEKSRSCMLWGMEPGHSYGPGQVEGSVKGLWVGEGLARYLAVAEGDSAILMGQSYYGSKSAAIYPIAGINHNPIPDIDRRLILAPIDLVREFAGLETGATTVIVTLKDKDQVAEVAQSIRQNLDPDRYEVMTWQEILAGRMVLYKLRNTGVIILKSILYFIVGFGILGTVLMTTNERKREYGILMAIGMKKKRLIITHLFEMLYISLIGVLAGALLVYPIMLFLYHFPIPLTGGLAEVMWRYNIEPLIIFSSDPGILFKNATIVFLITILVTFVPVNILARLNLMKAIRS